MIQRLIDSIFADNGGMKPVVVNMVGGHAFKVSADQSEILVESENKLGALNTIEMLIKHYGLIVSSFHIRQDSWGTIHIAGIPAAVDYLAGGVLPVKNVWNERKRMFEMAKAA